MRQQTNDMGYTGEVDPRALVSEWGQGVLPDETGRCYALSLVNIAPFFALM